MSKNNGYDIDWNRNTFIMTKRFAERASQIGTDEYEKMMEMRANGFHIVEKYYRPRKACPTRLTYKKMSNYIATLPDSKKWFTELNNVIEESKSFPNPYEHVRQWFMKTFPKHVESLNAHGAKKVVPLRLQVVADAEDCVKKRA